MEQLYAEFLLWYHGFTSKDNYEAFLNENFILNPHNSFLFELEELSSNLIDTRKRFIRYWEHECSVHTPDMFGKRLFAGLEIVYRSNYFPIDEFGRLCNLLWKDLPLGLGRLEPYHALSYADDCLSWDDEEQTRDIYERAFAFYKQ